MRIGLIAPPWVPVPPPAYGGTEVVIDNLARGLQKLGHEVRLFTVGESECAVPTDFLYPKAIAPIGSTVPETAHVLAAYESLADMDIIHDHTFLGPLIAGLRGMRRPPVVATNHGPFNGETQPVLNEIAKHASIVAISHSQARQAQAFGGVAIGDVIHHGIDLDVYKAGRGGGGYPTPVTRCPPKSRWSGGSSCCAAPTPCSTRSPGGNRSAWSWPRHWRVPRRCWPSPTVQLRRS